MCKFSPLQLSSFYTFLKILQVTFFDDTIKASITKKHTLPHLYLLENISIFIGFQSQKVKGSFDQKLTNKNQ